MLKNEGVSISLSSVARILRREGLTRKKRQLKPSYAKIKRPKAHAPGDLVQMDTIHYIRSDGTRFYIYVLIDVYSRIGYAQYKKSLSAENSYKVAQNFRKMFPFKIRVIQTDNGGEFSEQFYFKLCSRNIKLRHTRVRKPNDNAHVERFIRTIQEECFQRMLPKQDTVRKQLENYIFYYNNQRLHLGINCNVPRSFVAKVLT
jgi:transposase InsO family protein